MATDKVPNSSATAASAGSDLNGMAVLVSQPTYLPKHICKPQNPAKTL